MRKKLAAVAIAAGVTGALAGCGPAGYPSATYCVDQMGNVVSPNYCDSGYMGGNYMLFVGSVHSHTYHVGQRIPRTYISSGREIRPSDSAARRSAGLPFSGSVGNGTKPTATSKPAAPQQAPKSPSAPFGGSTKPRTSTTTTTRPSTSTRSAGGFSSGSSRSSSSSSSSSRSSSGGRR
jgi:hypothetical protein